MGLLTALLPESAARADLPTPDALGIELLDGNGQPDVFSRAATLLEYVPQIGLFLDNEEDHSGKRAELDADDRVVFFAWPDHTCVEDVLAHEYDHEQLGALIELAAELQGKDTDDLLKQLASEAGLAAVENIADLLEKSGEDAGRDCVASVMHRKGWFKKRYRGLALGRWMIEHQCPARVVIAVDDYFQRLAEAQNGR